MRRHAATAAAVSALLALTAAARPAVLSQASSGLWEFDRGAGVSQRTRQCVGDPTLLAQIEHRNAQCTRTTVRDLPTSAEVHYSCAGGSFGRTTISMITPRSFRIETQGISRGAPFHYVVQARRVGNCQSH